jgi:hypothetical protein
MGQMWQGFMEETKYLPAEQNVQNRSSEKAFSVFEDHLPLGQTEQP